jgi:hypothetical protein
VMPVSALEGKAVPICPHELGQLVHELREVESRSL